MREERKKQYRFQAAKEFVVGTAMAWSKMRSEEAKKIWLTRLEDACRELDEARDAWLKEGDDGEA